MSKERRTLRHKLFLARKAAEAVAKKGDGEGFKFATHGDVLAEASKQLEKRGILIVPSMTEEALHFGKNGVIAKAVISYEVLDTESDEAIGPLRWAGTGYDEPGDKALPKATTGCDKSFLAKLLGIPFEDDPEATHDVAAPGAATAPTRTLTVRGPDGPGLLVMAEVAEQLREAGARSDPLALNSLLKDCGISRDPGVGLVPVTPEQRDSIQAELERIKQDAAAEQPDVKPPRDRPLPETDLPEPDWTDLTQEEAMVDA